jgi:hypothetical protein
MTGAGAAAPAKELVSLADTTISTGLIERSAAAGEAEARWLARRHAAAA